MLLAASTGWVFDNGNHLFWTEDNGGHWKDISPDPAVQPVDVFFLDTLHGWVLLTTADEEKSLVYFQIAATSDAGQTWSKSVINVPSQKPDELDGTAWLDFVDPAHGWVLLHVRSNSAFSWGLLLTTDDGGKNWRELPGGAPIADVPVFVTPKDGWLSGIGGGGGTFRTRDGGRTWEGAGPADPVMGSSVDGKLHFVDPKHGFISETFDRKTGTELVLYATEDGGDTWKLDRSITDQATDPETGTHPYRFGPTCLVPASGGGTLLLTTLDEGHGTLSLETVNHGGEVSVSTSKGLLEEHEWAVGLSFSSSTHGWLRTSSGRTFTTDNGGASWRDISPIKRSFKPPSIPAEPS